MQKNIYIQAINFNICFTPNFYSGYFFKQLLIFTSVQLVEHSCQDAKLYLQMIFDITGVCSTITKWVHRQYYHLQKGNNLVYKDFSARVEMIVDR